MSEYVQVVAERRENFTMIPNVLFTMPISHAAFKLYCFYRSICTYNRSEDGECFMTIKTLTERCRMDRRTVISARDQLEEKGLIRVEKYKANDGSSRITVSLKYDIWDKNAEQSAQREEKPNGNGQVQNNNSVNGCERQNNNSALTKQQLGPVENNNSSNTNLNNTNSKETTPPRGNGTQVNTTNGQDRKHTNVHNEHNKKTGQLLSEYDIPLESSIKNPPPGLSEFHIKCGQKFKELLEENGYVPKNRNKKTLAEGFRLLELEDGISRETIKQTIIWYRKNIKKRRCPKAYSSQDFREKWNKIRDAMENNAWENDTEGNGYTEGYPASEPPVKKRIAETSKLDNMTEEELREYLTQ